MFIRVHTRKHSRSFVGALVLALACATNALADPNSPCRFVTLHYETAYLVGTKVPSVSEKYNYCTQIIEDNAKIKEELAELEAANQIHGEQSIRGVTSENHEGLKEKFVEKSKVDSAAVQNRRRLARAKFRAAEALRQNAETLSKFIKSIHQEADQIADNDDKEYRAKSEIREYAKKLEGYNEKTIHQSEQLVTKSAELDQIAAALEKSGADAQNKGNMLDSLAPAGLQTVGALGGLAKSNGSTSTTNSHTASNMKSGSSSVAATEADEVIAAREQPKFSSLDHNSQPNKERSTSSISNTNSTYAGKDREKKTNSITAKKDSKRNTKSGGASIAPSSPAATEGTKDPASEEVASVDSKETLISNDENKNADLGLAAALGSDIMSFSDIINNMLGIEEQPQSTEGALIGGRELASLNGGASVSGSLPAGVLNQESGTLFDRVKKTTLRLRKSGGLLDGLNGKI